MVAKLSAWLISSSLSSFNTKLSQTMPRKQLKHVTQENFQELKGVNRKNNHQCKNKIRSFYIILTFFPVGTDPVNETLSTSGCDESKWPVLAPPWTMFKAPLGSPASVKISAIKIAVNGVSGEGLNTIVFPQASAGVDFQVQIWNG